jgi:hypothetical protein
MVSELFPTVFEGSREPMTRIIKRAMKDYYLGPYQTVERAALDTALFSSKHSKGSAGSVDFISRGPFDCRSNSKLLLCQVHLYN